MRKKTKKKKRVPRQLSLAKNMALLFLSLGLLAGASFIFSYFSSHSDLSMDPIQSTLKNIAANDESAQNKSNDIIKETKPKISSVNPTDFTFYEYLNQKQPTTSHDESFTILVGTFKNRDNAKNLAKELKEKSKLSFRIEKKGKHHCVKWGTFNTEDKAQRICEKLSVKLQRNCKVVKM